MVCCFLRREMRPISEWDGSVLPSHGSFLFLICERIHSATPLAVCTQAVLTLDVESNGCVLTPHQSALLLPGKYVSLYAHQRRSYHQNQMSSAGKLVLLCLQLSV